MPRLALHLQANTVHVLQYFLGNPFICWGKTNTKLLHFTFIILKKKLNAQMATFLDISV